VWICPFADGHIQATGRDAKGRKQYRYHAVFREVRESTKYEHVVAFADALPAIREVVEEHMRLRGLPREKVLATVVHLLETTLIRVGNDDYAKQSSSYGLTTLKNRHVAVDGNEVRFRFTGKSGKHWSLRVKDRRVAKIIKACQDLPGQELLQYVDEAGNCQDVTSTDVNEYLKEITGKEITAKDFRTWGGRFSRRWRSMSSRGSTVPPRPSAICARPSKKWRAGSATRRPFAANAMCIRRC
jgi:DNA topoisomerase-1